MHALSVRQLVKVYASGVRALDGIDLDVPRGDFCALLGPNGAGKTSLIRMITTITAPDEGQILLDGRRIDANTPAQIGYMPEERGLYKKMKVGEHLIYLARLKGFTAAEAQREMKRWFEKFDIENWWSKKIEELSKGMQQKIQFIATVLHKPRLLILDEPFTGLDPINTNLIKDEIAQLNAAGTSIIFSTHRMEQVEEMCDHIVLINRGKNVLYGEVGDIKNRYKKHLYRVEAEGEWPAGFDEKFDVSLRENGAAVIQLTDDSQSNAVLQYLIGQGMRIRAFREILPTFNEIFIRRVVESGAEVDGQA